MAEQELITVREAARRLVVTRPTVEWLIRSGRLAGYEGAPGASGQRTTLVDAAVLAAIRGEVLERLHGCDTSCLPIGRGWIDRRGNWLDRRSATRCLNDCMTTGFSAGWNRWARRLGWRLTGGDPSRYPGPRGGLPGGWPWSAWLGCLLPVVIVVLLGALGVLVLGHG
jgi:hypothetical protein